MTNMTTIAETTAPRSERPLRVLILCPHMPPRICGIADYTAPLARELAARGVDMTVAHDDEGGEPVEGVRLVPLPAVNGRPFVAAVKRLLREVKPDILHIQYQPAMYLRGSSIALLPWLLRRAGFQLPIVTTFHDFNLPRVLPKATALRPIVLGWLARGTDHAIITNEVDRRLALNQYRIPKERLNEIMVGITLELPPSGKRAHEGFRVGYFGLVSPNKGLDTAMDAFALAAPSLPGAHFRLVGSWGHTQDYARGLKAQAERRGIADRVHFTEGVSREEASEELAAMDACVLLYDEGVTTRRSSFFSVMACGIPTLTTRNDVLPDGLENGRNVVCVPVFPDASTVAAALLEMARNPARTAAIGDAGAEWAQRGTWPRIAERHLDLYNRVAARRDA